MRRLGKAILALLLVISISSTHAADDEYTDANDRTICAPDLIALGGYDAVSYHQTAGPFLGSTDFVYEFDSLTYRFVSKDNLERFMADPEEYIPSYRGWCSTNLAMGRLACPDYKNFKIEQGRVLLFEHTGFTNGRDIWNSNPISHKQRADQNFIRFSE